MTNFDFISRKVFFICTVNGDGVTINNTNYTTIDVDLLSQAELAAIAKGLQFMEIECSNPSGFNTYLSENSTGSTSGSLDTRYYTEAEIDSYFAGLTKSSVGLSNVQNVDTTNASNISSGTLANERLTTNLSQIGNETFANGEVVQSFGGVLQNASLASGVTGMSITNSAGQILFDAPYAKGPLNQKSGIFEDFITYSATVISPYLLRTVSGSGATTSIAPALSSGDIRNGVIVFSTGTNSGGAAGAASGSLSSINFANIPEGGYEEVGFNFKIPILPDSTQQFLVNMGFGDSAFGGIPTDGVYISIGHTSGNATANTRSNSSGTTYHNIAISANTDTTARVRVSRISGLLYATYFINGTSMGAAIPTNIPSGASRQAGIMFGINKFAGTAPRTIELDWIYYESFKPRTINY